MGEPLTWCASVSKNPPVLATFPRLDMYSLDTVKLTTENYSGMRPTTDCLHLSKTLFPQPRSRSAEKKTHASHLLPYPSLFLDFTLHCTFAGAGASPTPQASFTSSVLTQCLQGSSSPLLLVSPSRYRLLVVRRRMSQHTRRSCMGSAIIISCFSRLETHRPNPQFILRSSRILSPISAYVLSGLAQAIGG